jgi:hypothetical protein
MIKIGFVILASKIYPVKNYPRGKEAVNLTCNL